MINSTEKKEDLILSYEIIDNKIIIKYIDIYKQNEEILYSNEKELEILNRMKKQLKYYSRIKNEHGRRKRISSIWLLFSTFFTIYNGYLMFNSISNVIAWCGLFLGCTITTINFLDIKKYNEVARELDKYKINLENKIDSIKSNNENINKVEKNKVRKLEKNNNYSNNNYKVKKLTLKK